MMNLSLHRKAAERARLSSRAGGQAPTGKILLHERRYPFSVRRVLQPHIEVGLHPNISASHVSCRAFRGRAADDKSRHPQRHFSTRYRSAQPFGDEGDEVRLTDRFVVDDDEAVAGRTLLDGRHDCASHVLNGNQGDEIQPIPDQCESAPLDSPEIVRKPSIATIDESHVETDQRQPPTVMGRLDHRADLRSDPAKAPGPDSQRTIFVHRSVGRRHEFIQTGQPHIGAERGVAVLDGRQQVLSEPDPLVPGGHRFPRGKTTPRPSLGRVHDAGAVPEVVLPGARRAQVAEDRFGSHGENRGRARVISHQGAYVVSAIDKSVNEGFADEAGRSGHEDGLG